MLSCFHSTRMIIIGWENLIYYQEFGILFITVVNVVRASVQRICGFPLRMLIQKVVTFLINLQILDIIGEIRTRLVSEMNQVAFSSWIMRCFKLFMPNHKSEGTFILKILLLAICFHI